MIGCCLGSNTIFSLRNCIIEKKVSLLNFSDGIMLLVCYRTGLQMKMVLENLDIVLKNGSC